MIKLKDLLNEVKLNEFNKAHFVNLIMQELESKKGQLAYANDKIRYSGTPKWERKEWLKVAKDLKKEIKVLETRVKQVSKMVEVKLNEKWDSPQSYSSKEAKNIIDGAIRNYAKELRKVQYKVIKDWMSKAKAGVIDYFDVVRGLTTGDITKAHPYESDFLHKVLMRDKIVQRFRQYFGGKKGKRSRRK